MNLTVSFNRTFKNNIIRLFQNNDDNNGTKMRYNSLYLNKIILMQKVFLRQIIKHCSVIRVHALINFGGNFEK